MKNRKKKKSRFTKYELILFLITGIALCAFPFMSIFAKSSLSEISYKLESQKTEITEQAKNNESLEMKINELASLDNLNKVAKKMGLSYTSSSIKTIQK